MSKPIHIDIRIQGTDGAAMLAVLKDRNLEMETQISAKSLHELMELCEWAIVKREQAKAERMAES